MPLLLFRSGLGLLLDALGDVQGSAQCQEVDAGQLLDQRLAQLRGVLGRLARALLNVDTLPILDQVLGGQVDEQVVVGFELDIGDGVDGEASGADPACWFSAARCRRITAW